jgi:Zn-dependent protease with chaperone function
MMKLLSPVFRIALILLTALPTYTAHADKEKGLYEPVTLHKREIHLVETAHKLERRFKRRGLRYDDTKYSAWLTSVARRLLPKPTDPYIKYRAFLIRDPSPNAFALADGQIYIHTGMLARLQNESQVAGLIAHETNHVAGHHAVVAFRSARKKAIASQVLGGVLGGLGGGWGSVVAGIADVGFAASILGYSRDLEEEADRRAVGLLRESGYDIAEFPKIFDLLNNDPEGEAPRIRAKWSTHPLLGERAAYLRGMVRLAPQDARATPVIRRSEYPAFVLPIGLMAVEDYIHVDYPRTALFLGQRLVKQHPSNAAVRVALGDAWLALEGRSALTPDQPVTEEQKQESRRARRKFTRAEREAMRLTSPEGRKNLEQNARSASEAYLEALEIDGTIPEAHRGLGEAYDDLGMYKDSARAYLRYLKLAPNAPDKDLVHAELEYLLKQIQRGTKYD